MSSGMRECAIGGKEGVIEGRSVVGGERVFLRAIGCHRAALPKQKVNKTGIGSRGMYGRGALTVKRVCHWRRRGRR